MPVTELTTQNFEKTVLENKLVFVDFWASWCAPCTAFAQVYEKLSDEYKDILFTKVNIENETELSDVFSIQSIPHLMVFKEGIVIYSESGSMPQSTLKELIEQAKEVDVSKVREEIDENNKTQ